MTERRGPTPWMLTALLIGCAPAEEPSCVPDRAAWDAEIRDRVSTRCGACHGPTPDNGAPFSLTEYDRLVAGTEGARIADRIAIVLAEGLMPPVGFPQPDIPDRDAIARWASCGEVRVTDESGLGATRPVFRAPDEVPEGLVPIDVTADEEPVRVDDLDRYHQVEVAGLVDEDVFVRRMSPIVDESRVLHHLVLVQADERGAGSDAALRYLYTWAPGTGPIELPGGGIRLRPSDSLRLELHYNNGAGVEGVRDSSGVRLWTAPAEGREYEMVGPGPGADGFSIPPRVDHSVESRCVVAEDVRAVAVMPHMHEVGTGFEIEIRRGDGRVERVLGLDSWRFETQLFYELPIDVAAGDEWTVRCHYFNGGDGAVMAGPATTDEMCFAFTYVTPPVARFCEPEAAVTELEYAPGDCAVEPLDPTAVATVAATHVRTADGPTFDPDAALADGRWVIERAFVASPSAFIEVATFQVAGQLFSAAGQVELDAALHVVAPIEGAREGHQTDFSFAGTLDASPGPTTVSTTCPEAGAGERFELGVVEGAPAARLELEGVGADTYVWMLFAAAP